MTIGIFGVRPTGVDLVTQAAAEEGTRKTTYLWSPERVSQAIAALETAAISQATRAKIEAETNENTYAPPDLIKHSPGVAKAWCSVERGAGTPSLNSPSHNVSSVTDDGAGQTIVTIDTDFSSGIYAVGATAGPGGSFFCAVTTDPVAGSFKMKVWSDAGAAADTVDFFCWAFGDQA